MWLFPKIKIIIKKEKDSIINDLLDLQFTSSSQNRFELE
jgi:hypothetical protein